jgi:methyl-accepting chemotaxis protein
LIDDLVAGRGDIDLSMRLPETEETEIADLQRSINTLLNKISAIVDLVINVSNSLATEASQLSTLKQSDP